MGRQERTKRAGESVAFTRATTGTTKNTIDNYGITELTSTTAESYVLTAPSSGIRKTLVCQTPTSAAVTVLLCTDGAESVTVGTTGNTRITFNSTVQSVVELVGINSTRWAVTSVYPDNVAANTTGTVFGTS